MMDGQDYIKKNPLGGPAKVFEAMAAAVRAGDTFESVLATYGFALAEPEQPAPCTYHCEATVFEVTIRNLKVELERLMEKHNALHINAKRHRDENARLVQAIEKTIEDNGHLADGDDCTLIDLVNAIKAKPAPQFEAVSDPRLMEQRGAREPLPVQPERKGLFIDMIAAQGPEFVEEMKRIGADGDDCTLIELVNAVKEQSVQPGPTTTEQDIAIREGHENACSGAYFAARPGLDTSDNRDLFAAGFQRAWKAKP